MSALTEQDTLDIFTSHRLVTFGDIEDFIAKKYSTIKCKVSQENNTIIKISGLYSDEHEKDLLEDIYYEIKQKIPITTAVALIINPTLEYKTG